MTIRQLSICSLFPKSLIPFPFISHFKFARFENQFSEQFSEQFLLNNGRSLNPFYTASSPICFPRFHFIFNHWCAYQPSSIHSPKSNHFHLFSLFTMDGRVDLLQHLNTERRSWRIQVRLVRTWMQPSYSKSTAPGDCLEMVVVDREVCAFSDFPVFGLQLNSSHLNNKKQSSPIAH